MITRKIQKQIESKLFKGKAILLFGARQVGKSTLLNHIFKKEKKIIFLDAENPDVAPLLKDVTSERLITLFGKQKIVIIDEAQKIPNIGSVLKLFTDYLKNVQVVATGSSTFELQNKTSESLTGRKWEFQLFPFSFQEMVNEKNLIEEKRMLRHRFVFGYYPEMVLAKEDLEERLKLLSESYLYKDILMLEGLQKPEKLMLLLKALAMQIGSEVNYSELGKIVGLKNDTIEKYIHLLEKTFILFRLNAYSNNHRKELKKGKKIYFFDNGIRNAILGNYTVWENRNDQGALFENFIISEMYKKNSYEKTQANFYFWRTVDQQEIDLIVEKNNILHTYEIKLNANKTPRLSKTFSNSYSNHTFDIININTVENFLLSE